MQRRHFRVPALAAVASLVLGLAACGGDSTGPAGQLDPQATQQSVEQLSAAFSAPSVVSFAGASSAIGEVLGPSLAVTDALGVLAEPTNDSRVVRFGRKQLSHLQSAAVADGARMSQIATGLLGRTLEWSTQQGRYVISEVPPAGLPAVPANGVRFLLYAWNPITERPVEPLNRIGYADLIETTGSAGRTYRLVVVGGSTTFLDYSAGYAFSQSQNSATVTIAGFVTNGTDRANFDLVSGVSQANNGSVTLDYEVEVPSRGVSLDYLVSLRNLSAPSGDEQIVLDLRLAGNGQSLQFAGTLTAAQASGISTDVVDGAVGTLTVRVNGGVFATITLAGTREPVIVNAQGQPLSRREQTALLTVFGLIAEGFDFIEDLLDPVDDLFD
jgi:hypothetical protein